MVMKDKSKGVCYKLPTNQLLICDVEGINSGKCTTICMRKDLCHRNKKDVGGNQEVLRTKLLIDKMIIRSCKRRQIGLAMACIDYKRHLTWRHTHGYSNA